MTGDGYDAGRPANEVRPPAWLEDGHAVLFVGRERFDDVLAIQASDGLETLPGRFQYFARKLRRTCLWIS